MNKPTEPKPASTPISSNPHELLDKPVANPKYGGQTMREVVRRAFLGSDKAPKIKPRAEKPEKS